MPEKTIKYSVWLLLWRYDERSLLHVGEGQDEEDSGLATSGVVQYPYLSSLGGRGTWRSSGTVCGGKLRARTRGGLL